MYHEKKETEFNHLFDFYVKQYTNTTESDKDDLESDTLTKEEVMQLIFIRHAIKRRAYAL